MGMARLNVWVAAVGDPCRIATGQWFVHIMHCDGSPLVWCDRRYINLETKCGHLDIEIPPGCYVVAASWSPAKLGPDGDIASLGNHVTHMQIVRADCAKEYCVTLYNPSFHFCGIWWLAALRDHVAVQAVNPDAARRAEQAVRDVLKELPADRMAENMLAFIDEKPIRRKPK